MQIKTIKIQGFKSFLHEIELHLQPGITGIVGPNGCGKSNLVDAIRWVIGEQSLKRIRAGSLEELLFNGSDEHPPTGMARVSILFTRGAQGFPEPYSQLNELSIERIYYRSGESEFRINRMPVRLKDILDLFLDTGSGTKAYSIIEQGYIGEIVSASAEQRRAFIEEAAGIMKYKTRKNAALRKMEATRENLRHIEAITSEIQRQMSSLNRQAQKARKYRDLKEKVKRLEWLIAGKEYRQVVERLSHVMADRDDRRGVEASYRTRIAHDEADIELLRVRVTDGAGKVEKIQEVIGSLTQELHKLDNEQSYIERSLEDLGRRAEQEVGALQHSELRLRLLGQEKKELEAQLKGFTRRKTWLEQMHCETDAQVRSSSLKEKHLRQTLEHERNELFGCLTRLAETRNLEASAKQRNKELEVRKGRGLQELSQVVSEIQESEALLSKLEQEKATLVAERTFVQIERSLYELYQDSLEKQSQEQVASLETIQEALHRKTSRLQSLLELRQSYEGYQEGVKAIMQRLASTHHQEQTGILGLVADVLETSQEYEIAVEAVLGERLQYVVTKSQEDGLQAIDYLKSHTIGRSSFIPLHSKAAAHVQWMCEDEDGRAESLLRHVRVKEPYRHIVSYLLRDVFIVPDLETALTLWEHNGASRTLVTKEGEMIDPYGVITGGTPNGAGASILKTRREIGELEAEVKVLETMSCEQHEAYQRLLWKGKLAETDIERLHEACYQIDLEVLRKEKDIQKVLEVLRITKERKEILAFEADEVAREIEEIRTTLKKYSEQREELERERMQRESAITALTSMLEGVLADRELTNEELSELEAEMRRVEEALRHTTRHFEKIQAELGELAKLHQDRGSRIAEIDAERENLVRQKMHNATLISQLVEKRSNEENKAAALRELVRNDRDQLEAKEAAVKEARKGLEACLEAIREAELLIAELELRKRGIWERIWEKYHVDLEQRLSPEGTSAVEDQQSCDEIKAELEIAYRDLERLGDVNPNAIEEYEELNQRHGFYKEQYEDLSKTLDSLQKLIQRINRLTKKRFSAAFEGIRDRFQKIFPKLFGGGKATLELTDPNNMLETGVDIVAQPPGKRLQNVTLLSGGEKALTALALLFAIFQYKPSPFCVLDEVDAALDDMNIHRFNELVREMSSSSQFIVITHNKQTMEIAGSLFGVVMETPGVSKIVSVRME